MEHRGRGGRGMDDGISELRAREEEIARGLEWLNEVLNLVARARAEDKADNAIWLLQRQAVAVGQGRVDLRLRMAELEVKGGAKLSAA
jgi:hypothetical protein